MIGMIDWVWLFSFNNAPGLKNRIAKHRTTKYYKPVLNYLLSFLMKKLRSYHPN